MTRSFSVYRILSCIVLTALVFALIPFHRQTAAENTFRKQVDEKQILENLGSVPVYFEENQGQFDKRAKYLARGTAGYTLFLTPTDAVYVLQEESVTAEDRRERAERMDELHSEERKPRRAVAVYMSLVGGNEFAATEGVSQLEHRTNYFRGRQENWRTEIPNYAQVRFDGVYPGVDILWQGNAAGEAVAALTVEPFADVSQIAWEIAGADDVRVTDSGELLIKTAFGDIVQPAPQAFQQAEGFRNEVEIAFEVSQSASGRFRVGYRVGEFDRGRAFEIGSARKDVPATNELTTLSYSTYLGDGDGEGASGIAVDSTGNAYVTGATISLSFPTTAGAFDPTNNGSEDAFVTKLNSAGSGLVYSTYLGGFALERGFGIAVDSTGNAFVAGRTDSSNFPTTGSAYDTSHNGGPDIFVTKLNAAGSGLVYSTFIGASGNDFHNALAVDSAGNAYVTGVTFSTDYPTTTGAYDTSYNGAGDVFVTKLNAAGSGLDYSTFIGASGGEDGGTGIAVDSAGNAFVAGFTNSPAFPTTAGAYDPTHNGSFDAFVTKLNAAGSGLDYSTFLGGSDSDGCNGITFDGTGNAYVTGSTLSTGFPTTTGAYDTSHNGNADVFVTKLNTAGSGLGYSTFLGGSDEDRGIEIAIDSTGNAYVTGFTLSIGFPTTTGAYDTSHNGVRDVFVSKLNAAGSGLDDSTFLGGNNDDIAEGIAVTSTGTAFVTGRTNSAGFPTTLGAFDVSHNGVNDVFITKLAPPPTSAQVVIGGRVFDENGYSVRGAIVTLTQADGTTLTYRTNSFGYYRFDEIPVGQTVIVTVRAKGSHYNPQLIPVSEDLTDLNFFPIPPG